MSIIRQITLEDVFPEAFSNVDVQYSLPITLDSVHVADIDVTNSDNGGFSGVVTDYFDSLETVNNDASATNPKIIKIWFNRTIQTSAIGFGCNDLAKSFSNIVIKTLGSGEVVRDTFDAFKNDNTKRNSQVIDITPAKLNGLIIEFHTADEIGLSNLIIFKSLNVTARLSAISEATGQAENINSFEGALNVTDGLVHRAIVNEYFARDVGPSTTLAAEATVGDTDITVADSTGFVTGDLIKIGITYMQEVGAITITNVVGNVITLDRPIAQTLPIGTVVKEIEIDMTSLAGTLVAPAVYTLAPPPGVIWQITRLLITMADNLSMDDGKFGGIASLTNGVVGVADTSAGRIANISNWKNNGDMASDMFNVEYTTKAPAGEYGLRGRWTLTESRMAAELNGDNNESLYILVQDDITANSSFKIKA